MAKNRQIATVQVETWKSGSVWIHVTWDGKPDIQSDGTAVTSRYYTSFFGGKRRGRLLKRARQMQSIIEKGWA
jgi:hypothetical protein